MKRNILFSRSAFLMALIGCSLSVFADEEEEFKRKKDELAQGVEKIYRLFSEPRSDVSYIENEMSQALRICDWVKDYYSVERDWAEKRAEDLKDLRDTLQYFRELHKIFEEFPRKVEDYQNETQRRFESILKALEEEQNNLKQDLSQLDYTERKVRELEESMRKLATEVGYYIDRNENLQKFKDLVSRVQNYSGDTEVASRLREGISRGTYERQRIMEESLKRYEDKYRDVTRGLGCDSFARIHYKLTDAIKLYKNNAQEVIDRTKELNRQKEAIEDEIEDLAYRVKDGKIREAIDKDIEIYKRLTSLYEDAKRSIVFNALPTQWTESYAKETKEKLYPCLMALEESHKIFTEVRQKLTEIENRAEREVRDAYDSAIGKSNLTDLGKAGEQLYKDYERHDEEIVKKIQSGMEYSYKVQFSANESAFSCCQSALQSNFEKLVQETKSAYGSVYQKDSVRYARLGNRATEGPFSVAVDKILQANKQEVATLLRNLASRIESGDRLRSDDLSKVFSFLETVARSCQDAKVQYPHWVPNVARDMQQSAGAVEAFEKLSEMYRLYPQEISKVSTYCQNEYYRLERYASEMTQPEKLQEFFANVQQTTNQCREELRKANDLVRDYTNCFDKLNNLGHSDDLSYPFFLSLKKRVDFLSKGLLESRKQLEIPQAMSALRGFDPQSQNEMDAKLGFSIMNSVLKLLQDTEKFHRMRIGNLADRLSRDERILSEITSFQKEFDLHVQMFFNANIEGLASQFAVSSMRDAFNSFKELYKHFDGLLMIQVVVEEMLQFQKEMEAEIVQLNQQNLAYVQEINALQEINNDIYKSWQEKYKALQKKCKKVVLPNDNPRLLALQDKIKKCQDKASETRNSDLAKSIQIVDEKLRLMLEKWKTNLEMMLNWESGSIGDLLRRLYEKSTDAQQKFEEEVKKYLEDLKKVTKVTENKKDIEKYQKDCAKLLIESIERKFDYDDGRGSILLLQTAYAALYENYSIYAALYSVAGDKAYAPALAEWITFQQRSVELLKICYDRYERQHLEFYKKPAADIGEAVYKSEEKIRKYGEYIYKVFESINSFCKNDRNYTVDELSSKIDFLKEFIELNLDANLKSAAGSLSSNATESEVCDFMREVARMSELSEARSMKSRAKSHWNIDFGHLDEYVTWKETAAGFPSPPENYINRLKEELRHFERQNWQQLVINGYVASAEKELEQYTLTHPNGECQTFAELLSFLTVEKYQEKFLSEWSGDFGNNNEEMLNLVKSLPAKIDELADIREKMIDILNESYDRWSQGVYQEAKDPLTEVRNWITSVRNNRP